MNKSLVGVNKRPVETLKELEGSRYVSPYVAPAESNNLVFARWKAGDKEAEYFIFS